MSRLTGYIYDPEYDERYVPDSLMCDNCSNEAEIDGLCRECYDEDNIKE